MCGFSSSYTRKRPYGLRHPDGIRLTVGVHDRTVNEPSAKRCMIRQIVPHPVYHPDSRIHNRSYDVALIELQKPLVYSDKISPICVDDSVFKENTMCYVTGWGYMNRKNDIL